jgi:hypothetical protein
MLAFDKYLLLGGAVLLFLAGTFITYQTNKIDRLEAENAVLEAGAAATGIILDRQSEAIDEMARLGQERIVAIAARGARIAELHAELDRERVKRSAAVEKDYALPDCAALLATDLAAVCPAHAQRLRDAAAIR